jgi:hypothetical protein
MKIAMLIGLVSTVALAAPPPGKGERALRASFYRNTIPTLVEMVREVQPDVLESLELTPAQRTAVERTLNTVWTAQRINAHAGAALEQRLGPKELEAGLRQMTPEIQAMIEAGTAEATSAEQAQQWLAVAQKHPDAKEREALARRIVAHLPRPEVFRELVLQVADVFGDTARVVRGDDSLRAELRASLLEGLEPALQAMGHTDTMVMGALAAYREQPTAKLKALADALDSGAGSRLQKAAPASLLSGLEKTRGELVTGLQRELKPRKK